MMKHSKLVVATILGGLFAAQAAVASTTQTVTWEAAIPDMIGHDDYVITGHNGFRTADYFKGDLTTVASDATFHSTPIHLQLHANTGTASAPVVGDRWSVHAASDGSLSGDVTWGVTSVATFLDASLITDYGLAPDVKVIIDGAEVAVGASSTVTNDDVQVSVKNDTALDPTVTAGRNLSVQVAINASGA